MPERRDWANLPSELAHLIASKLPADLIYFLSFRSVCKNWRSSLPLSHFPPQLPWLIQCHPTHHLQPNLRFYSLAGGDTGTMTVPMAHRGDSFACYGPGHGYLFLSSLVKNEHWLLNPLNGHLILLPFLDHGLVMHFGVCGGFDLTHNNWHVLCCRPFDDIELSTAAIYHADENAWKYIDIDFLFCTLCNTFCCDGKLFATDLGFWTMVFDVVSGQKLCGVSLVEEDNDDAFRFLLCTTNYLVESCGEILRVACYLDVIGPTREVEVYSFDIYKLCSEGGRYSWVKVSDIGNQVVFLDRKNGFTVTAPAGFKGNCIYFLSDDGSKPCRYDIGTRTMERLPCPFKNCTWFIPNLG